MKFIIYVFSISALILLILGFILIPLFFLYIS